MKYGSLAVRYRPETLSEVVGQKLVVKILNEQLIKRTFKNAYGFFGNSGCGKTTIARIFARAINNNIGEPIEIDGASAGSVETIRALIDNANQRAISGEYKIIIIDECQMLGGGRKENSPAWSALLKTIEEAPKYTIFIFCSTNPEKIPEAILNRVQRFNFTPISTTDIYNRLVYICQCEHYNNYEQTCDFISRISDGCMREAINKLEKCVDFSTDLNLENTKLIFNGISYENMFKLTWAIQNKNKADIITIIENMYSNGQDLKQFISNYTEFILDLIKYSIFKDINLTNIPSYLSSENNAVVQFTTKDEDCTEYFNNLIDKLFEIKTNCHLDTNIKSTIIISLFKFIS